MSLFLLHLHDFNPPKKYISFKMQYDFNLKCLKSGNSNLRKSRNVVCTVN